MIHLRIVSVSKPPRGAWLELTETFQKHLKSFARLELVAVKEERFDSLTDRERVQKVEGERLLAAVPDGSVVIVMDEHGKTMTSPEFAKKLQTYEDAGQAVCFLIGGPLGLSAEVKKRASWTLALSSMTLPHDLAKVVVLEQLYRAGTLIKGKTYHY